MVEIGRPLRGRDRLLALMDVGAVLCRPRDPRCAECPLRRRCATRGPLADETPLTPGAVRGQLPAAARSRDGAAARGPVPRERRSTPTRWRRSSTTASPWSSDGHAPACPDGSDARDAAEEVAEEGVAGLGEDRLGVELHALDREVAVAQAHDQAVLGLGA